MHRTTRARFETGGVEQRTVRTRFYYVAQNHEDVVRDRGTVTGTLWLHCGCGDMDTLWLCTVAVETMATGPTGNKTLEHTTWERSTTLEPKGATRHT